MPGEAELVGELVVPRPARGSIARGSAVERGAAELEEFTMRLRNRLILGAFIDDAGISEREVARRAGLSHSTVNHLMSGRRATCALSTAVAIARAVGCPVGALFIAEKVGEQRLDPQVGGDGLAVDSGPAGRPVWRLT